MSLSDREFLKLLDEAKFGDEQAAESVLRDVQSELAKFIQSKTRNQPGPVQAADILQTVLYQAWMQLARCDVGSRDDFLAWLRRIAENRRIDSIRLWTAAKRGGDAKPIGPRRDGEELTFLIDELTSGQASPATGMANRELRDFIIRAIENLPENYSKPIKLFYFENLSGNEAAERLQISEGAAFARLSRAREMLREQIFRMLGTSILR